MKKRILACILSAAMVLGLAACGNSTATQISAATRDKSDVEEGVVYIDDEAIALAAMAKAKLNLKTTTLEVAVTTTTQTESTTADDGTTTTTTTTTTQPAATTTTTQFAYDVLTLVNEYRASQGLKAYTWDTSLAACADVRAQEIASYFSHTRPNGSQYWTVNSDLMWGENLAEGYDNAQELVQAWINSPTHQANLVGDFDTCSIGVYVVNGWYYVAQEFGYY